MLKYVRFQNSQDKIRYEQEMEQWKTYMRSRLSPGQKKELEGLKARNDELDATISEPEQSPEHSSSRRTVFSPNPFRTSSHRTDPIPEQFAAQR